MIIKTLLIWILIACGEILNGNFRVRFLQKRFGQKRAKQMSFISGSIIIFIICWFSLPWINPSTIDDCFIIGLIWMILMACVDIYFGRYVFHYKWETILDDFDLRKGNLLSLGMIFLFFCPSIVFISRLS